MLKQLKKNMDKLTLNKNKKMKKGKENRREIELGRGKYKVCVIYPWRGKGIKIVTRSQLYNRRITSWGARTLHTGV